LQREEAAARAARQAALAWRNAGDDASSCTILSSMSAAPPSLPGFRPTCLALGGLYVFIAGSLLLRGPAAAMADYAVPEATRASPHYADAIFWVFLHMTVIGLTIAVIGWFADGERLQRAFARLMLVALCVYTFLDVRAADWALGTGLYEGSGSLGPVVVDALSLLLWLRLNLVRARPA
jgi:hypothetical protein